jgi:hypothetical protein
MNSIVFFDEDDNAYCNSPCDALLIPRKDGSMICSYCNREYLPNSVKRHKRHLGPVDDAREDPILVPMTEYGSYAKKKKPSVFDREDRMMASKSGFSWVEHEDFGTEDPR